MKIRKITKTEKLVNVIVKAWRKKKQINDENVLCYYVRVMSFLKNLLNEFHPSYSARLTTITWRELGKTF